MFGKVDIKHRYIFDRVIPNRFQIDILDSIVSQEDYFEYVSYLMYFGDEHSVNTYYIRIFEVLIVTLLKNHWSPLKTPSNKKF